MLWWQLLRLHSRQPRRRRDAATRLGVGGSRRAVPSLVKALKDRHYEVREAAAGALGELGDARAVPALMSALSDTLVHGAAVKALARLWGSCPVSRLGAGERATMAAAAGDGAGAAAEGSAAAQALASILAWHELADTAKKALGLVGGEQVVRALVSLLTPAPESDLAQARRAAEVLESMGWQPADAAERARYLVALERYDETALLGPVAVAPLLTVPRLSRETPQVIVDALAAIGRPAVEALVSFLADESSEVRRAAAKALGEIADPGAADALLRRCQYDEVDYRSWPSVAWALGRIGDRRAVPVLVARVFEAVDRAREPCWSAIKALASIGDCRAIRPLAVLTGNKWVSKQAVEALEKMLETKASKVSEAELECLAGLEAVHYVTYVQHSNPTSGPTTFWDVTEPVSTDRLHELAQAELGRRSQESWADEG